MPCHFPQGPRAVLETGAQDVENQLFRETGELTGFAHPCPHHQPLWVTLGILLRGPEAAQVQEHMWVPRSAVHLPGGPVARPGGQMENAGPHSDLSSHPSVPAGPAATLASHSRSTSAFRHSNSRPRLAFQELKDKLLVLPLEDDRESHRLAESAVL